MNILNIEDVYKSYGEKELFSGASLGINKGDKIGLIGVNGTGKSTLLKIAAGLVEPEEGRVVKGKEVRVTYLPQMPDFQERESVLDYVMRERHKTAESEAEAKNFLTRLGITDMEQQIAVLSGGQKKRVALAAALVDPAEVLILDEPTNHLDNDMVLWLEEYIRKFKGELLMVTHDRYFLDNVTNRIAELDRGQIYTYDTNYSGFLTRKAEKEEIEAATENKRQNMLRTELAWIQRGCQARSTKQQARIDRFSDMKAASREARARMEKQNLEMSSVSSRLGKKTIELHHVSKAFGEDAQKKTLISDFTYIFLRDDRIGIVGKNGCGKTTLMKIITGQLQPDAGTVETGETVRTGYFMQENEPMNDEETVLDCVRNIGEYVVTTEGRITASQMCEKFLFPPKMQWTRIGKLSGGEKRRLYLLTVLMSAPNVLILDEPTNDLDIETLEILEDYLDHFAGIIIVVSHDRYFLDRICDRIFAFEENGTVRQYEGGFTDYNEKRVSSIKIGTENREREKNGQEDKAAAYSASRQHSRKLSYMEQKELGTIDAEIEGLEQKQTDLEKQMLEAATQYSKLNELMAEKEKTDTLLEEKMERWVYLHDLEEEIEKEKEQK